MQINTKQFRITRKDKRSQTVGKNFLYPVVEVKPYNPWQSIYLRDFKKSLKKNASQAPKMTIKNLNAASETRLHTLKVSQNQQNLPNISKAMTHSVKLPVRTTTFKIQSEVEDEDEDKEFEIKPNISQVFPNAKSYQDKKLNCILKDNTEYFAHVMRKCICGICTCGHCKCTHPRELNLGLKPKNELSLYKQDYINHGPREKRRMRKQKTEQLAFKEPFSGDTLYRVDYVGMDPKKVVDPQNFQRIERPGYEDSFGKLRAPFPASSLYDETYLNWQNTVPVVRFNDQQEYNNIKIPFTGKPSNQDYGNFKPEDITDQVDKTMFGKSQFKNPLGPNGEFKGESTTHNTFKKIEAYDRPRNFKENYNKENNINADGHFKSTYKDYNGDKPTPCPAREIISTARQHMITQSMVKYSDLLKKLA